MYKFQLNFMEPKVKRIRAGAALCTLLLIGMAACGRDLPRSEIPVPSGSAAGQMVPESTEATGLSGEKRLARALAEAMTTREKCAQLLMIAVGIRPEVPEDFGELMRDVPAGAVLLLSYNIAESPEKIMGLNAAFQKTAAVAGKGVPFLIALDHEGGTVYRLGAAATRIPGASRVGSFLEKSANRSSGPVFTEALHALYAASAKQLALLGFSLNLAPVLEPLGEENREFLRHRSYGADPYTVSRAGEIFIRAMGEGGVLAAGKHFPGTGRGDPHEVLTRLNMAIDMEEGTDPDIEGGGEDAFPSGIFPFHRAVAGGGLAALMVSHVLVPGMDPLLPVSLSGSALSFIRRRLGFEGIILTDDINMKAVSAGRGAQEAAVAALAAGADMIMYLDERGIRAVHSALVRAVEEGRLPRERLEEAVVRVLEQKIRLNLWKRTGELMRAAEDGESLSRRGGEFSLLKKEGDALLRNMEQAASRLP